MHRHNQRFSCASKKPHLRLNRFFLSWNDVNFSNVLLSEPDGNELSQFGVLPHVFPGKSVIGQK